MKLALSDGTRTALTLLAIILPGIAVATPAPYGAALVSISTGLLGALHVDASKKPKTPKAP